MIYIVIAEYPEYRTVLHNETLCLSKAEAIEYSLACKDTSIERFLLIPHDNEQALYTILSGLITEGMILIKE